MSRIHFHILQTWKFYDISSFFDLRKVIFHKSDFFQKKNFFQNFFYFFKKVFFRNFQFAMVINDFWNNLSWFFLKFINSEMRIFKKNEKKNFSKKNFFLKNWFFNKSLTYVKKWWYVMKLHSLVYIKTYFRHQYMIPKRKEKNLKKKITKKKFLEKS